MSATLKLTHKTIGVEVRRGTYDAMVDGKSAGSVELNETIDIPVDPGRHTLQVRNGRNSSALLRLFAPFLPFATEEAWSWWQEGFIHRASWPDPGELSAVADGADPRLLDAASAAIGAVRGAKSAARLSMRASVRKLVVSAGEDDIGD